MAKGKVAWKVIRWGLYGLSALLVCALAALAAYGWVVSPQTRGSAALPGLDAAVEIWRDDDDIATIRAASEMDAYRALGFLHAQERLWQMDMTRRAGAGRLSELIGEATLELDRLMRTLQLYAEAEKQLPRLSPELRAALDAYAEGVNGFMAQQTLPTPEFLALGYEPEPWTPTDSLVWGNLMALQLSGDWTDELLRVRLAERLSPEQIDFLWPRDREGAPVTLPASAHPVSEQPESREARAEGERALAKVPGEALARLGKILPWPLEHKSASNWWVVAGARSITGLPILANDPHLGLDAPGTWMLTRLEWPDGEGGREVRAGVTAPGVPFLVLGHNGHLAWGFTTTHGDTQDLYVEQLSEDGLRVETPDGWTDLEKQRVTIAVKDGEDVIMTLRRTPRGPIISDVLEDEERALFPADTALSLSWPLYDRQNRTPEAFYRMGKARNALEFKNALALFYAPQQNVAFADRLGNIGFALAGVLPKRPLGDGSSPLAAWVAPFAWEGRVPFEELPQVLNPPEGKLVNANNRIAPPGYPNLINRSFPDPARAIRIEEMLGRNGKLGPTEAGAMQLDVVSVTARDLLPLLLPMLSESQRRSETVQALEDWDRRMTRRRAEPTIFAAWMRSLQSRLLADETGPVFEDLARPDRRVLLRILTEQPVWCDDVTSPEPVESCEAQVRLAYQDALDLLEARLGPDWRQWRWERLHRAPFGHPLYKFVPVLNDLVSLEVGTPGWDDTVNRGGASMGYERPESLFQHRHGPGLRAVYDLSDLENSRFMIAPGQSGNLFSGGYGNLVTRWRDGRALKLVGAATDRDRLLLLNPAQ
ncbi:MAG: penicillin acylase family protein [Limibacillus sp.]